MKLPNGTQWTLNDARHILDLKRNLISTSKLDKEGYVMTFGDSSWKVTKGSMVFAKGNLVGSLYLLTNVFDYSLNLVSIGNDASLWHNRLGHMSEKGMKILHSNGSLPNLKEVDLGFCENCVYGKQRRVNFLKVGKEKKSHKLELVHTDVWGPAQVCSFGGSSYFVTFIDDCTRKTWVYYIKKKSDVFETFKRWKALVENETNSKLKCLKFDNGGEFCNNEFDSFCSHNGIRRIKVVPRTPQENGVAERMNRTILERARSMRIHAGFPLNLWADAIDTAVYLINRGPSMALDGDIPEEMWTGKKVNYSFLRVFGCEAFAHVNKENRNKLDAKS